MFNTSFDSQISLFFHVLFLLIGCFYAVFALFVYFQITTLEKWLSSLKRYNLKKYVLIHLIMSVVGIFAIVTLFL
jgi:hypothetical protein